MKYVKHLCVSVDGGLRLRVTKQGEGQFLEEQNWPDGTIWARVRTGYNPGGLASHWTEVAMKSVEGNATEMQACLPEAFAFARRAENGYELSTRGDKGFSALVARLADGRTIEEAYQLDVKGYRQFGNDWRLGKGKAPLRNVDLQAEYLALWRQWVKENPGLIADLRTKAAGRTLTDMFASTPISQARALAVILNEG